MYYTRTFKSYYRYHNILGSQLDEWFKTHPDDKIIHTHTVSENEILIIFEGKENPKETTNNYIDHPIEPTQFSNSNTSEAQYFNGTDRFLKEKGFDEVFKVDFDNKKEGK